MRFLAQSSDLKLAPRPCFAVLRSTRILLLRGMHESEPILERALVWRLTILVENSSWYSEPAVPLQMAPYAQVGMSITYQRRLD
jgi:hypothetical protein